MRGGPRPGSVAGSLLGVSRTVPPPRRIAARATGWRTGAEVADDAVRDGAFPVGVALAWVRVPAARPGTVSGVTRGRQGVGAPARRYGRGGARPAEGLAARSISCREPCGRVAPTRDSLAATATRGRGGTRRSRAGGGGIGPRVPQTTLIGRGIYGRVRTKAR